MKRSIAIAVAWRLYGTPYMWGGDDPIEGFDCSGAIIEILRSVGVLPHGGDWTAQGLYSTFKSAATTQPRAGCLSFYGANAGEITHVMFHLSDEIVLGATGGGSKTKTRQDAIDQNAFIKIRPLDYRDDLATIVDPFLGK